MACVNQRPVHSPVELCPFWRSCGREAADQSLKNSKLDQRTRPTQNYMRLKKKWIQCGKSQLIILRHKRWKIRLKTTYFYIDKQNIITASVMWKAFSPLFFLSLLSFFSFFTLRPSFRLLLIFFFNSHDLTCSDSHLHAKPNDAYSRGQKLWLTPKITHSSHQITGRFLLFPCLRCQRLLRFIEFRCWCRRFRWSQGIDSMSSIFLNFLYYINE